MKQDKLKVYILELALLTILSFTLFVPNIYGRTILAVIITIFAIFTWYFIKKQKISSIHASKVTLVLVILAIIYLIAFYAMGLYFDYYKALITFNIYTIMNYIIPTTAIIISSEIIRNVLLGQNTKYSKILTFTIMVIIDLIVYVDIYNLGTFKKTMEAVGFVFFASVACNLLYNYISCRYGMKGNIIYRLITVLYVYFIPYIPNVYVFFRSILRMIYPYIIYQILEYTFDNNNSIIPAIDRRKSILIKILLGFLIIIIAMLVSCEFKYGILVIGSGSMTDSINKGDAILFKQYNSNMKISEGEIIIFEKNDSKIVHRVVKITKVNGENRYTTKGDANKEIDEGYITDKDIKGIYKYRIAYMGYPTLWIRDIYSSIKK